MPVLPCGAVVGFSKRMGREHIPIFCALQSLHLDFSNLLCPIPGGIRVFNSIHKDADGNDMGEYKFTYDMADFGDIVIHTEEGDTLEGSISIDKKGNNTF
ncbi:MAG: hypothetical protein MZV70_52595 [Desulfobacterales bacterium]|nr:hypothetical protein [Desulfobacterales bacterium]